MSTDTTPATDAPVHEDPDEVRTKPGGSRTNAALWFSILGGLILAILLVFVLQNLDRVTLVDTDISGISADALVIGINMSLANGTYSQSLDVRFWARPGAWILGVRGFSELSQTTWIY